MKAERKPLAKNISAQGPATRRFELKGGFRVVLTHPAAK